MQRTLNTAEYRSRKCHYSIDKVFGRMEKITLYMRTDTKSPDRRTGDSLVGV